LNDPGQILVGLGGLEHTTAEIDPGNLVAIGTVAVCATLSEYATAVFDVRGCLVLS
jgi:hypothetical protein